VQKKWGEAHADFMAKFVKVLADSDAAYRANPGQWDAASPQAKAIAAKIGGEPKEISEAIKLYAFPPAEKQASATWLGGGKDSGAARAIKFTADFLKDQRRIDSVAPDYSAFVTPKYVEAALKLK
jgi:taurine transport system substrate-binding protein